MVNDSFGRGLIVKNDEHLIYTNRSAFEGILMVPFGQCSEKDHKITKLSDSIGWFMNSSGAQVFYSSETAGNRLCVMSIASGREEVLLDEPCYGIKLYGDWIYYINENSGALCKIQKDGRNNKVLVQKDVVAFLMVDEVIYYTTSREIIKFDTKDHSESKHCVLEAQAIGLALIGNHLFFADQSDRYTLCRYNLHSAELHRFEAVMTTDICVDETYLYCANLNDNKSIYRVGTHEPSSVRICSESAYGLHRIEGDLWFYNLNDQASLYRMPSEGGQAVKMMTQSGA